MVAESKWWSGWVVGGGEWARRESRRTIDAVPAPTRHAVVSLIALASLLGIGFGAFASPASAHPIPPGFNPFAPSPVKATIDSYEPDSAKDTFDLKTYGAIAHHWLQVKRGHEVIVHGYQDEPFMRIDAEGKTYDNLKSPTLYINQDAGGSGSIPPTADAGAAPDWKMDATGGGTVSWHDHRTHWMVPEPPTTAKGSDVIQDWQLNLTVDGSPVTVKGALHLDPAISWSDYQIKVGGTTATEQGTSKLPYAVAAAIALVVVALVVRTRRSGRRRAAPAMPSARSGDPRERTAAERRKQVQKG